MRKTLLSISCLFTCMVSVQAGVRNLGTDRQVNNCTDQLLSAPDMDIAFNGWIYNAHQSGDGITIKISQDQGLTWKAFASLHTDGESYGPPSVVVAGKDAADLHLFIAAIRTVKSTGAQHLFLRRYNAVSGILEAEPVSETVQGRFYTCDLATDYDAVSKAAQSFSVSLLYATGSAAGGNVMQKVSADGGITFPVTNVVAAGNQHYRHVSICYGRSTSASNGRYFMAWDEYATEQASLGKVYTSRSAATVLSATIPPVRIDQPGAGIAGKARKPVIAVSTGADNDSASCTAIVLMEMGTPDGGTAVYSVSNKRPHFTNYWTRQQLSQEGSACMAPAIAFNAGRQAFAASYYDKGSKSIHLLQAGLRRPQSWQSLAGNYADNSGLSDPRPCVAAGPFNEEIALSWAAPASGHTIYFDATGNRSLNEITDLHATSMAGNNILSWKGNSTEGIFILERSADGHAFEEIASLPAGTVDEGYSYTDATAPAGDHYYRIRYTAGGAVLYSKTVAAIAMPLLQDADIRLYPNPAVQELHLVLAKEPEGTAMLIISDIAGKTVLQFPVTAARTTLDIHRLPAGTYYARYSDRAVTKTMRFTKITP